MCRARITSTATGGPLFTNRLALETSPYLQQHAHNPVELVSPGVTRRSPRALRRGQAGIRVDRLFDLSLVPRDGAPSRSRTRRSPAFLNRHFVSVKVDREERPDVDAVYMRLRAGN
jgi:hypothetical protein